MVDIRILKQPTIRLVDPEFGEVFLVGKQEEFVRDYMDRHKMKQEFRGFHWYLKREGLTYYDLIKDAYE